MDAIAIIGIVTGSILYLLVIFIDIRLWKTNKEYIEETGERLDIVKGNFGCSTSSDDILFCICCGIFFILYPFLKLIELSYIDYMRRRADRDSEKVIREDEERKQREIKEFENNYQEKKKERIEKVSQLRASGFKATKENRKKVIDLASSASKINLAWVSETTRIPEAEIVIIIDEEEDYEIQEEYIINKKKTQKEYHTPTSSLRSRSPGREGRAWV